ncbi:hypothetical protein RSOL_236980, partial [Rhizoctonia solani AG-3 Rhs1AP]
MSEDELQNYGIDWEELENEDLMHHFAVHDEEPPNAPLYNEPELGVVVVPPEIGAGEELAQAIEAELVAQAVDVNTCNMLVRRRIWDVALETMEALLE